MVEEASTRPVTPGYHAHLRHCVTDAARLSPEEGSHKLEEANRAIVRLVRS